MSNPNPPGSGRPPRAWAWIVCLALAAYAVLLGRNFSNVAGGADSSGYLNSARLLASGHLAAELRTPPEFGPQEQLLRQQFQPHGFVPFDGNPRLSPTYAVGLPLHLALAGRIAGWELAPMLVGVGAALACLILIYAVGRQLGLPSVLAATAAVVLAAYPVFLFMSIQPLSDTLATAWCLLAVHCALRSRGQAGWAAACGSAVAVAVLVRATNLLVLPAVMVLLGVNLRRWLLLAAGGIPGALWLGYYNHALYGSPFRSGYVDISQAFGWKYGGPTLIHFIQWIALMLPAVVLVLPFAAAVRRVVSTRNVTALTVWFAAFTGLYAFYEISHEVWWDLRFILPGTPALILGALLGLQSLAERYAPHAVTRTIALSSLVVASWAIGLGSYWTGKFHLLLTKTYEQAYADAAVEARRRFPPDSLVVAGLQSGSIYYYTNFSVLRWEFVSPPEFAAFRAKAAGRKRAICALLFDLEEREALQQKCPGPWAEVFRFNNISLWKLAESASDPLTSAKQ